MNKKGCLLAVAVLALATAAHAANNYTAAGCGLGSILFKGKGGKAQLILAATTNGSFGSQTFGISSETLDCTADGVVKSDRRVEVYAAVNLQRLSREMAQGGGEFLSGLSTLMGCQTEAQRQAFFKLAQARYETLFPAASTDSTAMLASLKAQMSADPILRAL